MIGQVYVCVEIPQFDKVSNTGILGDLTKGKSYKIEALSFHPTQAFHVEGFKDDAGIYRVYTIYAPYLMALEQYRSIKINELLT